MQIANNILKHNLENVLFLGGTACGGKTTMGRALAEKYGFIHYDDNYHTPDFARFQSVRDPRYQPANALMTEIRARSWEEYFSRLAQGDTFLDDSLEEHLQFNLLELVKLSRDKRVVADLHLPVSVAKEITGHDRVAFLTAEPETVIRDYYEREDHRDIYDLIMTLEDPETSLQDSKVYFQTSTQKLLDEIRQSGFYYIVRDTHSTVEKTLSLLEKHFGLTPHR